MKLTFIISGFNEQSVKALPWKYVYELAKNLTKKGCKIQIITDGDMPTNAVDLGSLSISTVSKTRQFPMFSMILDPRQVDNAIEQFSPSLVWLFGDYLVGYSVRRLKNKIPTIVNVSKGFYSFRNVYLSGYLSPYFCFINSPIAKYMVRLLNQSRTVAITVPTSTIKRSLEECGVESKKIIVLPMAAEPLSRRDATFNKDEIREKLGSSKVDFTVAYFGPPYARRGVYDLIHAIAALKHKLSIRLLLLLRQEAGQGSPELDSIKKLSMRLGVADRVALVASVLSNSALLSYLDASDIVALPFRYVDEEPPLGLLEAMALEKPVITTNIDSLPEVVGDNRGILVRPGSVSDLCNAIYYLFMHPEKAKQMAAESRSFARTLKDWDELADYFVRLAEKFS